ncbi:MAG: DDE-type integrase/transposase/recombinase [Promethearchaeota archaeon]|jgi:transposase InsO family protein
MTHIIHPTALFRISVLGPLVSCNHLEHGELKKIIHELAARTYKIPNSNRVYLNSKTIERWYYQWHKHGINGLMPKSRKDKGNSKLPEDIQQLLLELKKDNPARSLNTLISLAKKQGARELVRSSVYRLLRHHNLSKRSASATEVIERRAFEALFAGDIWYGDVMHGPCIQTAQGKQKTYLVSIMDDASRLICHSAFCLNETALSIEFVLKQALLKRGLPKRFVIDNGPAYRANTLQSICARLNIRLIYCRPYEPEGKGKLERFHRTFREQFLTEIDIQDFNSLDELNARLWVWIERIYHQTVHSALQDTPISRFQHDLLKIKPLGNLAENLDEYFYYRVKRFIRKDGTLSYNGSLYEVSFDYAGQHIYLVLDPHNEQPKWIESLEYERLGHVHLLDKQANNNRKRKRPATINKHKSKTSLVEVAYKEAADILDLTKETK